MSCIFFLTGRLDPGPARLFKGVLALKGVLKLKNPIMINNEEVKEVNYNFDSLTLEDMVQAEKQLTLSGCVAITTEEFNMSWHSILFAYTAAKTNKGTAPQDYMRLSGRDAIKARELAKNFILGLDSADSPAGAEENSEKQP